MLTGLILTNTSRLASVLSSDQNRIRGVIASYVSSSTSYIDWQVVDISDEIYADIDKTNWSAYIQVLDDYYIGLGLQNRNYCPLFIIGGDDIVPMPTIRNPLYTVGHEHLYSDMAYCFDSPNVRLEDFVSQKPRFAVGRLPLTKEWGVDGLVSYLNDCVDYMANGISIRGAAMTTTQSWLRASDEMMRDIPTVSLSEDYVPLNNRMIVSPDLDTEDEEMYDGYIHELKKVDFLVCNLHGSDQEDVSEFSGQALSDPNFMPTAIQVSMLSHTTPYIFNTVACYGGRFMGYKLEESMMLSAMAYGTMLYCGSCDTAYGGSLNGEASCSELMMKLYNLYLHKGLPAGLALIKAKQDYYRTCHDEDGDENAMYTILEFNLFGCPSISMKPKLSADYEPKLLGLEINKKPAASYRPKTREVVSGGAYKTENIHAYLRGLVDNNLSIIRQKVEVEVYQRLGLGRENLQQVMRVSQNNCAVGYQFLYEWSSQQSHRRLEMYYIVDTDINGNITKLLHTK